MIGRGKLTGAVAVALAGVAYWSGAGIPEPQASRQRAAAQTHAAVAIEPKYAAAPAAASVPAAEIVVAQLSDAGRALSRDEMVVAIKQELARVGCYAGPLDTSWGETAVVAIRAFSEHLDLPIKNDEPHHVLLTLLQGYRGAACRLTCPRGQTVGSDGVCRGETVTAAAPPLPPIPSAPIGASASGRSTGPSPGGTVGVLVTPKQTSQPRRVAEVDRKPASKPAAESRKPAVEKASPPSPPKRLATRKFADPRDPYAIAELRTISRPSPVARPALSGVR
jgi:hypothetical protein